MMATMSTKYSDSERVLRINVGGEVFQCSREVLEQAGYFAALLEYRDNGMWTLSKRHSSLSLSLEASYSSLPLFLSLSLSLSLSLLYIYIYGNDRFSENGVSRCVVSLCLLTPHILPFVPRNVRTYASKCCGTNQYNRRIRHVCSSH